MEEVWFGPTLTHSEWAGMIGALALDGEPSPALALADRGTRLLFASKAFFRLFDVPDAESLLARLVSDRDPGGRRLATLCQHLPIGGVARLERLRFSIGPASEIVTFLCRRILGGNDHPVLVAAALGLRAGRHSDARLLADNNIGPDAFGRNPSLGSMLSDASRSDGERRVAALNAPSDPVLLNQGMNIQAIQATLRARWPASRSVRFLWQTDADLVCTQLTPPLADVVGAANGDLVGRNLLEVASRLDGEGRFASALASKQTWSGLEVGWPVADAPAAVLVGLGAIPAYDRERIFEGYRGYGVIRLDQVVSREPVRLYERAELLLRPGNVVAFPGAPRSLSPEDQQAFDTLGTELREEAGLPEPEPSTPIAVQRANSPEPEGTGAAVESVEPPQAGAPVSPSQPSERLTEANAEPSEPSLPDAASQSDLAKHADVADHAGLAERRDLVPQHDRAADVSRNGLAILDRVGVGLLVSRDNVPIFANRHLLDLTGFAGEDALHAAGGLAYLFGGMPGNATGAETVGVRRRDGSVVSATARMQRMDWDGLSATLLTLQQEMEPKLVSIRAEAVPADASDEAGARDRDTDELRELRAILETATDGVAVIDAQCNVLSLNRSGEALFGCERSEVVGQPFIDLFAPHDQALIVDYFEGLKSSTTKQLLNDGREFLIKARQGGTLPVFMTLGRLGNAHDDAGAPRFCALFRDLTPWKKVEQELDGARLDAERTSALKSDFLARVNHEIRTPLNAIIGFAEVILEERFGAIGSERYREYLRDIHASGTHVMSLVNDLLDLSKIEAGRLELALDPVDLNKIINDCVALMQPQASRERVIMRLSLAPSLPQIKADERSLRQIVLNILSNAVKFNEPGGQVIVATAITEDGTIVVRVRDTGPGMSESDIVAALEPFRQLATTRPTIGGTGLGLPLTKALVEANEATFTIRSKVDQGTLVEVLFPVTRVLAGTGLAGS